MSTMMMGLCWPLQMEPAAKAVLVSLADQANDMGYCWPAVSTMARRTCLSERTVQRALRVLEVLGLICSEIGAMKSNRYVLQIAALMAAGQRDKAALETNPGALEVASKSNFEADPCHGVTPHGASEGCHGDGEGDMVTGGGGVMVSP